MKRILKHACSRRSLQATSALAGLMFALSAGSALADPIALVLDKSQMQWVVNQDDEVFAEMKSAITKRRKELQRNLLKM